MSEKIDHTMSVAEVLSIIFMAIQAVMREQEAEAELREAEAAQDAARQREAKRQRDEVHKLVEAEVAKREAKNRLQGQLGDAVADEIDRNGEKIAPRLKTRTMLSAHGDGTPEKKLQELERHLQICEMTGRGLIPEYDPHYQKSKAWVQRNVVPEQRQPSLEELAGTVSHRHVKEPGYEMEY